MIRLKFDVVKMYKNKENNLKRKSAKASFMFANEPWFPNEAPLVHIYACCI